MISIYLIKAIFYSIKHNKILGELIGIYGKAERMEMYRFNQIKPSGA